MGKHTVFHLSYDSLPPQHVFFLSIWATGDLKSRWTFSVSFFPMSVSTGERQAVWESVWESGCQPGPFTTHQSGGSRSLIDCSLDNNRISGVTTPALSINKQVSQQILAFAFLSAFSMRCHFYSSVETYNEVSRQTQHGGGDCLPQCLCRIRRVSSDWQQINRRWELCLNVFLQIIDVPVPVTAVEWDSNIPLLQGRFTLPGSSVISVLALHKLFQSSWAVTIRLAG